MIQTENRKDTGHKHYFEVAPGVWGMKDTFVNFYMARDSASGNWVLIDAGLKTSAPKIKKMAKELFGSQPPSAIILTHGHFDHIGSVAPLAHEWKVEVYAHYLEFPYLSDISCYPPPDPTVGGGLMSAFSVFYPNEPIDISGFLQAMPDDNKVPFLEGWKYIHTPGHAPGHISLFRESDRLLIAGDAVVTTKAESMLASLVTQKQNVYGPPMYFTFDWDASAASVRAIAALNPSIIASGHGKPYGGDEMIEQLKHLSENFDKEAIPGHGRYVGEPAITDASGTLYIPRKAARPIKKWMTIAGIVATGIVAFSIVTIIKNGSKR
jgi:glyoxylase-like metal-dependent hydrolase (beta-lactamase superfamily II)